uniref:Uncharacterized protein n=1 Tax=viral metagenome TaxID=1070528 RepID=A0A6C0BDK7_9ZZZZ
MDLINSQDKTFNQIQEHVNIKYIQENLTTTLDSQLRDSLTKKIDKEDELFQLFEGSECLNSRDIFYGDSNTGSELEPTRTKVYFQRLHSLNLPNEIKRKIQDKILTAKRRVHIINDEMLCAYAIRSYYELGIQFDIYKVYEIFGINPCKSNVMEMVSNCTTKQSIISDENISVNVISIRPSDYVRQLLTEYVLKFTISMPSFEQMIKKIEYFSTVLTTICPILMNKTPLDTASAISYFYILKGSNSLRKEIFSKKIFYSLQGINKAKFDESLKYIITSFEELKKSRPEIVCYIYDYSV